jgi:hypothetical protein
MGRRELTRLMQIVVGEWGDVISLPATPIKPKLVVRISRPITTPSSCVGVC